MVVVNGISRLTVGVQVINRRSGIARGVNLKATEHCGRYPAGAQPVVGDQLQRVNLHSVRTWGTQVTAKCIVVHRLEKITAGLAFTERLRNCDVDKIAARLDSIANAE